MKALCKNFLTVSGEQYALTAFDKRFCKARTSYEYEKRSVPGFDPDAFNQDGKY